MIHYKYLISHPIPSMNTQSFRLMRDDTNYYILGKLKCCHIHKAYDEYEAVIEKIIHEYRKNNYKVHPFIIYVHKNHRTFKPCTKRSLIKAFVRFQEEAMQTYGLEHSLCDFT